MARLGQGYLALDAEGWLNYDIAFLWQNEPIINDAVLKREPQYWADRRPGTFKACSYGGDGLIPT